MTGGGISRPPPSAGFMAMSDTRTSAASFISTWPRPTTDSARPSDAGRAAGSSITASLSPRRKPRQSGMAMVSLPGKVEATMVWTLERVRLLLPRVFDQDRWTRNPTPTPSHAPRTRRLLCFGDAEHRRPMVVNGAQLANPFGPGEMPGETRPDRTRSDRRLGAPCRPRAAIKAASDHNQQVRDRKQVSMQ